MLGQWWGNLMITPGISESCYMYIYQMVIRCIEMKYRCFNWPNQLLRIPYSNPAHQASAMLWVSWSLCNIDFSLNHWIQTQKYHWRASCNEAMKSVWSRLSGLAFRPGSVFLLLLFLFISTTSALEEWPSQRRQAQEPQSTLWWVTWTSLPLSHWGNPLRAGLNLQPSLGRTPIKLTRNPRNNIPERGSDRCQLLQSLSLIS